MGGNLKYILSKIKKKIIIAFIKRSLSCFSDIVEAKNNLQYINT